MITELKCDYCNKPFVRRYHLTRHYDRCKIKKQKDNKEETELVEIRKILENKEKEMTSILESREKYKREVIDLKKMVYNNQREFIEYAKEQGKPKNVSNVFYIQNNFKNAFTMDKLLREWEITYPEWVQASVKGYVAGCTELIENQFIKNKSFEERPMHCLDPSRGIFMFNDTEMGWMKNAPVDINSVITNVDNKFNEFNRDYQEEVPKDEELRNIKHQIKEEDPIVHYYTLNNFNKFIPPKHKKEEGKDSEYEKSKKKIIKNLSVKCAFNKPLEDKLVNLDNEVVLVESIKS